MGMSKRQSPLKRLGMEKIASRSSRFLDKSEKRSKGIKEKAPPGRCAGRGQIMIEPILILGDHLAPALANNHEGGKSEGGSEED